VQLQKQHHAGAYKGKTCGSRVWEKPLNLEGRPSVRTTPGVGERWASGRITGREGLRDDAGGLMPVVRDRGWMFNFKIASHSEGEIPSHPEIGREGSPGMAQKT